MNYRPLLFTLLAFAAASASRAEDISTSGWRLWPDQQADWKNDTLYLPADVHLGSMPVNPPTGGWQVLNGQQGVPVTLPTTVEEHYWGKFGTRPYTTHEAQKGPQTSFLNGNYLGVSWWWKTIHVPVFKPGQRVIASFRGARLRSEVYCNGELCGYSIMTELPFQADLTDAVKSGQDAQLAVRITNPGGNLDWIDFATSHIVWGKYILPPSHGFGGLDEDIQLQVRDDTSITDVAAINKPDLHQVHLQADVTSVTQPYQGPVHFQINRNGQTVWSGNASVSLAPGETKTIAIEATVPSAQPWDIQHPNLYHAQADLPGLADSDRGINFGFRYFTTEGIGTSDAKLVLNGKRIVLISAISWGYWGRNGLWPDKDMAEREVTDAKTLGLNCLQFHRNIGKPAVLDDQDRLGLLRCEEPGAGKFVIGTRYTKGPWGPDGQFGAAKVNDCFDLPAGYVEPDKVDTSGEGAGGDPQVFWEKYEQEKILEMVKRDRSHPSLILYNIQNEASSLDLRNPRIYRILRLMHALDPSRIITFFSGGDPKTSQVLMRPYTDDILYGSKTLPYAGWKDVHTCGGPCNYMDNLYQDPAHYFQRQPVGDKTGICVWGEMLGSPSPDDYEQLVHSFDSKHPTGYELADMTQILAGYHAFLDKYGFRAAFPTDSSLFKAIGYHTYYFWQRILEQSRADNRNDGLVVSGWESTTIDNHSGIVDNHRFFKGDPRVIAKACQPQVLFLQPRHMIAARGEKDLVDVFLINDGNRSGPQTLKLTAKNSDGSVVFTTERQVTATGGDVYGQLLSEALAVPADAAGMLNLTASLTPQDAAQGVLSGDDQIEVIDVPGTPIFQHVAVVEPDHEVTDTLKHVFHVQSVRYEGKATAGPLDAIILATKTTNNSLDPNPKPAATATGKAPDRISRALMDDALRRVRDDGTRLVLWSDTNAGAEAFCKELAREKVVTYDGYMRSLGAPWFGDWFFVRKHWLLDGLPVDCAMDWRYGISAFGGPRWLHDEPKGNQTEGQFLDAPGIEVVVGYGADHNTHVGVSGCVIPYGKGEIVFYCLPQLVRSLAPGNFAISPVICDRLLGNALRPATAPQARADFTPEAP